MADRRTTCLPKYMEQMSYLVTGWRLGRYYRTYPAYVKDEVRAALDDPDTQFLRGPITLTRPETLTKRYTSIRRPGPQLPVLPLAR
jgi:hypothetical protein